MQSSPRDRVVVPLVPDPAKTPELRAWARGYYDALHEFNPGAAYVNFMMDDEGSERIQATYGPNYERLVEVKRKYDPANLFRGNENITPERAPRRGGSPRGSCAPRPAGRRTAGSARAP